jgi:hypothetical protein
MDADTFTFATLWAGSVVRAEKALRKAIRVTDSGEDVSGRRGGTRSTAWPYWKAGRRRIDAQRRAYQHGAEMIPDTPLPAQIAEMIGPLPSSWTSSSRPSNPIPRP